MYTGVEDGVALFDAVAGSFSFTSDVTVYNYVTIQSGAADSDVPPAQVSINGGEVQSLPATLKVTAGDVITASATLLNDVDYEVANWTDADGNIVSEGADLNYTVSGDATITMRTSQSARPLRQMLSMATGLLPI